MEGNGWRTEWELRADGVPKQRYLSREFAELEARKLWPHVWQMACRLEEIPEPGDYTVYDIVDQSILIVRTDDRAIRAYHNACRHRGTALASGSGHFPRGQITCPFHGWQWSVEGENTFVLDRDEFPEGSVSAEELRLREVRVATYAGCVFINMDPEAPAFEDVIAPAREWLDPLIVDQMKFYWHREVKLAANWKVAQEAFFEGYHVAATHPQLDPVGRDVVAGRKPDGPMTHRNIVYRSFPGGHGVFQSAPGRPAERFSETGNSREDLILNLTRLYEGMDAMVLADDVEVARSLRERPIPEGSSVGQEFTRALYEHYARRRRPLPEPRVETLLKWGGEIFIFPNFLVLPQFGNALVYRSRPDGLDPDSCIFELWSIRTYGEGESPPPPRVQRCDPLDRNAFGLIPRQDFSNIPRIQRGLHSRGFEATRLSARQEANILHMHRELDRYLKR